MCDFANGEAKVKLRFYTSFPRRREPQKIKEYFLTIKQLFELCLVVKKENVIR